jgi:hypothetical protein
MQTKPALTPSQIDQFHRDGVRRTGIASTECHFWQTLTRYSLAGFLLLPGFASPEDTSALRQRAAELEVGFNPNGAGVFSTRDQAG